MDLQLTGSRVLVTGGTRGIGRAIVEAFARRGRRGRVLRPRRRRDRGDGGGAGRPGPDVTGVELDVGDGAALPRWVEAAARAARRARHRRRERQRAGDPGHRGELAGQLRGRPDGHGAAGAGGAAVPGGSSDAGPSSRCPACPAARSTSPPGPYGTMKTAIVDYIHGLAFQLAERGIRANAVSPGNTYFEGGVWAADRAGQPGPVRDRMALNPTGRMGTPEEIAARRWCSCPARCPAHDRHEPRRRRGAHPRHPALSAVRPAWRSSYSPSWPMPPSPEEGLGARLRRTRRGPLRPVAGRGRRR